MSDEARPYSHEELVRVIRLAHVYKLQLSAQRFSALEISGAQLTCAIATAIEQNTINYKIDYRLILNHTLPESESQMVGDLEASVIVAYEVVNPARSGWEESVPLIASMAVLTGHPYLRQAIASLAAELGFPSVTLGLVRYGSAYAESVTVGDRVFNFADGVTTEGEDQDSDDIP